MLSYSSAETMADHCRSDQAQMQTGENATCTTKAQLVLRLSDVDTTLARSQVAERESTAVDVFTFFIVNLVLDK